MSANTVATNAICAGLFSRAGDGKFHWSIIIPSSNGSAAELHATNNRGGGWFYERKAHKSIYNSATICVLVQIGTITTTNTVDRLDQLVKSIPMSIPAADQSVEPEFTCRVWFKEAVRVLNANGVLRCPDVYALESELIKYGKDQDEKTITGHGYKSHVAVSSA